MSKELSLVLEDGIAFQTGPDMARLWVDGDALPLDIDDLGKIAEWLAVAWENLAGEKYKPVVISERGYVAQEGVVRAGERVIPKSAIGNSLDAIKNRAALFANKLERDCE